MTDALELRARRANGVPLPSQSRPFARRVLTSPWTWVTFAAVVLFALIWFDLYRDWTASVTVRSPGSPDAVIDGASPGMIRQAAFYAMWTLLFWIAVFLIADRFRPQRPLVWFLALGWGSCIAVWLSRYANTWAAGHLGVVGSGDGASQARVAIFVAPFIEEGAKATVLFWLAILVRQRLVSKLSLISLGGLSAAGFAFTENIQYYWNVIWYATRTIDVGDAQAAVDNIVRLRGIVTAFGHPLFTIMTAVGVAIALRARTKVVRVLAPLAGYLLASGLHMVFNSQATLQDEAGQLMLYVLVALPMVLMVTVFTVVQAVKQSRLIRSRLTDYVRTGWLTPEDPVVFSRLRTRLHAWIVSLTWGGSCWLATLRLQHAMTELAYLRDAEARGLVDEVASARAREVLGEIQRLRPAAVDDPRGRKLNLPRPRWPWSRRRQAPPPGGFGDWSPPGGPTTRYSAVDPSWAPPPG